MISVYDGIVIGRKSIKEKALSKIMTMGKPRTHSYRETTVSFIPTSNAQNPSCGYFGKHLAL